jgi:sirohydrochlorin ferrochelatase
MCNESGDGLPTLIVCAHGTRDPAGRATIEAVVAAVAARLPAVSVQPAYVDVHGPDIVEVVDALPPGEGGVVVPLLLAGGYHVHVDIADTVARRPDVVATPALGPDDRLVGIVLDRLAEAGATPGMPVVLVPAGSSDARAQADSAAVAQALARRWGGPVTLGFAAGPQPSAADAVALARADSAGPVALASYLLAPGFFQRRLEEAGGDVVTGPLAPDDRLVDIVVDRYRSATRSAPAEGP